MRTSYFGNWLTKCVLILLLLLLSDCTNVTSSSRNSSNIDLNLNDGVKINNITTAGHSAGSNSHSGRNCCDNIGTNTVNSSDSNNNSVDHASHRLEVEFVTKVVQNEYIVQFDSYYSRLTREKYIQAALNGSNVRFLSLSEL